MLRILISLFVLLPFSSTALKLHQAENNTRWDTCDRLGKTLCCQNDDPRCAYFNYKSSGFTCQKIDEGWEKKKKDGSHFTNLCGKKTTSGKAWVGWPDPSPALRDPQFEGICRGAQWSFESITEKSENAIMAGYVTHTGADYSHDKDMGWPELYHQSVEGQKKYLPQPPTTLVRGIDDGFLNALQKYGALSAQCSQCRHTVKYHVREGNDWTDKFKFINNEEDPIGSIPKGKLSEFCMKIYPEKSKTQFVSWTTDPNRAAKYALTVFDRELKKMVPADNGYMLSWAHADSNHEECKGYTLYDLGQDAKTKQWAKFVSTAHEWTKDVHDGESILYQWAHDEKEVLVDLSGDQKIPIKCLQIVQLQKVGDPPDESCQYAGPLDLEAITGASDEGKCYKWRPLKGDPTNVVVTLLQPYG